MGVNLSRVRNLSSRSQRWPRLAGRCSRKASIVNGLDASRPFGPTAGPHKQAGQSGHWSGRCNRCESAVRFCCLSPEALCRGVLEQQRFSDRGAVTRAALGDFVAQRFSGLFCGRLCGAGPLAGFQKLTCRLHEVAATASSSFF